MARKTSATTKKPDRPVYPLSDLLSTTLLKGPEGHGVTMQWVDEAGTNQEKRIGVFVCACATNIASVVDVNAVSEDTVTMSHVVHVENKMFTCSSDTQDLIAESIKKEKLNAVVVAV